MTNQVNLDLVWASTGGVTDPGDVKYQAGWVSEIPTYQNFNFVLQNHSANLLALAERGSFEWQTEINYDVGSEVCEGGIKYFCITANSGNQPSLDNTESYWTKAPFFGGTVGAPSKLLGLAIREINARASGILWTASDATIQNSSALLQLNTTSGAQKNWLLGNVAGSLVAIDCDTEETADGRDITPSTTYSHKLYHEGNKPAVSDISGAVEEAPNDGILYARKNQGWIKVTTTEVTATPPAPAVGAGAGWYNLTDGQFYVDIDDGDSSQWVPASPPVIPTTAASSVEYDDSATYDGFGTDVQEALGNAVQRAYKKNYIINGGFKIWQRGTSTSLTNGADKYLADRWKTDSGAAGSDGIVTQEAFAPGQTDVSGEPEFFHRMHRTAAVGGVAFCRQRIENLREFSGRTFTLSFWARNNVGAGHTFKTVFTAVHGDGGSANSTISSQNILLSNTWQYFEVTVSVPSLLGKTIGDNNFMQVEVVRDDTTNLAQVDVAQVQLEEGPHATKFEYRSYGEELALCQRYYQEYTYTNASSVSVGQAVGATTVFAEYRLGSTMRDVPTATYSGSFVASNTTSGSAGGTLSFDTLSEHSCRLSVTGASGLTSGNASIVQAVGTSTLKFDAEL